MGAVQEGRASRPLVSCLTTNTVVISYNPWLLTSWLPLEGQGAIERASTPQGNVRFDRQKDGQDGDTQDEDSEDEDVPEEDVQEDDWETVDGQEAEDEHPETEDEQQDRARTQRGSPSPGPSVPEAQIHDEVATPEQGVQSTNTSRGRSDPSVPADGGPYSASQQLRNAFESHNDSNLEGRDSDTMNVESVGVMDTTAQEPPATATSSMPGPGASIPNPNAPAQASPTAVAAQPPGLEAIISQGREAHVAPDTPAETNGQPSGSVPGIQQFLLDFHHGAEQILSETRVHRSGSLGGGPVGRGVSLKPARRGDVGRGSGNLQAGGPLTNVNLDSPFDDPFGSPLHDLDFERLMGPIVDAPLPSPVDAARLALQLSEGGGDSSLARRRHQEGVEWGAPHDATSQQRENAPGRVTLPAIVQGRDRGETGDAGHHMPHPIPLPLISTSRWQPFHIFRPFPTAPGPLPAPRASVLRPVLQHRQESSSTG